MVSITFGSEKAWRWQCAHQELRVSCTGGGSEALRKRQREANERYGALQKRFRRLQQKQMTQVMLRWMLGARYRDSKQVWNKMSTSTQTWSRLCRLFRAGFTRGESGRVVWHVDVGHYGKSEDG